MPLPLSFHGLTPEYWNDFVTLFGERGACGGCWCMLWRLRRKQFEAQKGAGNKKAMKAIVDSGEIPGILTFYDDKPVGWCAVAPRERYSALYRSRILRPLDDRPSWAIACFFIERSYRKKGIATALLQSAVTHARSKGAKRLEGYPVEPKQNKYIPPVFAWTGIPKSFLRAGFKEVARRSPTRPAPCPGAPRGRPARRTARDTRTVARHRSGVRAPPSRSTCRPRSGTGHRPRRTR